MKQMFFVQRFQHFLNSHFTARPYHRVMSRRLSLPAAPAITEPGPGQAATARVARFPSHTNITE